MLTFNTSRPLFRNNPALRKAVNFALDRQALQAISGGPLSGRPTDQYIPPLVHGFRDGRLSLGDRSERAAS
jgi:ABC-type transport system substrate-binding protein